ncbi:ESPR-type extended signal peptide-containing protein, partial [Paraburkholderia sp.]|uniref:YadA family autotransporter adhesin n=1 Tax=Paraburkholderia sp. TaxID=1926495 RepID=UPI0025D739D6
MNRAYRLIWNERLGAWVVTAENAKARGKGSRRTKGLLKKAVAVSLVGLLFLSGMPRALAGYVNANGANTAIDGSSSYTYYGNTISSSFNGVAMAGAIDCGVLSPAAGASTASMIYGTGANYAGGLYGFGSQGTAISYGVASNVGAGQSAGINTWTGAQTLGNVLVSSAQVAIPGGLANTLATGMNSLATGCGSQATGLGATAMGWGAVASGAGSFASGINTSATGQGSLAIGTYASAVDTDAIALGTLATAGGNASIAIGAGAQAIGTSSISVGKGNVVSGNNSGAIGDPNTVSGSGSYSIGNDNTIANDNSFVLGNNVTTTQDNAVVLGNNSADRAAAQVSSGTINGTSYDYAGTASGVVSVGAAGAGRQIINVAPGEVSAASTDAVNGSQLYATNQAVDSLGGQAVKYDTNPDGSVNDSSVTLGGTTSTDGGVTGGTKITNVTRGDLSSTSTDAVNGSQLYATNQSVAQNTTDITNIKSGQSGPFVSDNSVTSTQAVSSGGNASAGGFGASATGANSVVVGNQSTDNSNANATVLGQDASIAANVAGSNVALGQGSTVDSAAVGTSGTTINGTNYSFAGVAPAGVVSVGSAGAERQITNVAAGQLGATSTDAVNGSQMYATNQAVDSLGAAQQQLGDQTVKYDTNSDGSVNYSSVTLGGTISTDGGVTGGTKITNVAQGDLSSTSTDAVNGSQLNTTNQNVAQNTTDIASLGDQMGNVYTTGTEYFHANSTGTDSQAV